MINALKYLIVLFGLALFIFVVLFVSPFLNGPDFLNIGIPHVGQYAEPGNE